MDPKVRISRQPNPKESANLLSLITFFYTAKTFYKCFKKDLEEEDIFEVLKKLKSSPSGDALESQWRKLKQKSRSPTVFRLLWTCYGSRWLAYGCIEMFLRTSMGILVPLATGKLVQHFIPDGQVSHQLAVVYAVVVISAKLLDSVVYHNYFLLLNELCTVVRTACCSLIYRKSLKLSPSSMTEHNTGSIVTLMTKDVQYIDSFMQYGNEFWIALLSTFIITSLLYLRVGFAAIVGIGILFIVVPLEVYFGKKAGIRRMETCRQTDIRLQETQEIVSSIKILKMYSWEVLFADKISAARKQEIMKLRKVFYMKALSFCVGFACSYTSFYTLLVLYIHYSKEVTAENLYFMIGAFEYMKFSIALGMPHSITAFAEMFAALKRIGNLLGAEELPTPKSPNATDKPKIFLQNVSFSLKDKTILNNVSCTISRGLNAITGSVGSGKSSLFKAILQDYPIQQGNLQVCGTISYASQEPWLFPGSIRENILFGATYDEKKYQEILDVCALRYDLDILANGDETIVEDRGANLSKGQQTRVNMARAVYRDCDIYLLDDCLASIDIRVKEHIFRSCIKTYLAGKIVLFVSHDIKHIEDADQVILMSEGGIKSIGNPIDISENELLTYIETAKTVDEVELKDNLKIGDKEKNEEEFLKDMDNERTKLTENGNLNKENIYREIKKEGSVDFKTYLRYFKFGGGLAFALSILCLYGVDQFCASFLEKTLTNWVNAREDVANLTRNNATNTTLFIEKNEDINFFWSMYSIFIIIASVSVLIRSFVYYIFISKISINIHRAMILNVVGATMAFFDNTFIGNILNRFSRDLASIDEQLPFIIDECLHLVFVVLAVFGLVASVNPYYLISAAVTLMVLVLLARCYAPTGRSLKRLDSATRSPMVGHINSTLEGLTTIRAFNNQKIVQAEFDRHQDLFTSAYHMSLVTTRAFAIVVDVFSTSYIISVISSCLVFRGTPPGNVGLALSQAFKLTGVLQWGIFQYASLENQMTSVERVLEYTDVKSENKNGLEPQDWPKKGSIVYKNVSLTYKKTNETVLRNISLEIPDKSKIGIVGRTGAGKSSIISTLFRLYDVQGKILIDGVDIKTIALDYLRSNITIIPQDPLLFAGTVRYNIDPERKYSDKDIWRVLEVVGLKDIVRDLDTEFCSTDSQISAGQKQLLCLARALIRKAKIVVLDEATASLDAEIDQLIHKIICEQFENCTVITIAHKLDSIMHADKVIVLGKGEIVEFDSPKVLLDDKSSTFSKMVAKNA